MRKTIFILGLVALVVAFLLIPVVNIVAHEQLILFFERYSSDGEITCPECVLEQLYEKINPVIIAVLIVWVISFTVDHRRVIAESGVQQPHKLKPHLGLAYLFSCGLVVAWIILEIRKDYTLYREDQFFEQMTVALMLGASLLLAIKQVKPGKLNRWYLILAAVFFFVLGMEEISWGQRIFDWQTPETLVDVNYQDETNLHNSVDPIVLKYIEVLGNSLFACVFLFRAELQRIFTRFFWGRGVLPFIPPASFSIFGYFWLFLIIQTSLFSGELTEEVLSVFGFAYALNILLRGNELVPKNLPNDPA